MKKYELLKDDTKLKLTDEYLAYDNDNVEYYFTDSFSTMLS